MKRPKILLIFVDGLGIGEFDYKFNPLTAYHDLWPCGDNGPQRHDLSWKSIDACLGVDGLPQSATGQTAILTGINAPQELGKHVQGFPSKKLISILKQESIFVKLDKAGYSSTFANAYRHPEDIEPNSRLSVTSHAFKASGKPFRSLDQIQNGEALYHDFTNEELRKNGYSVPDYSPEEAGIRLADLSTQYDFTLYEHFMTDVVAHRGSRKQALYQISILTRFIHTVLDVAFQSGMMVIVTSDHGNIEDRRTKTHTRNPVPLMWTDIPGIDVKSIPNDISGITPWILHLLSDAS